MATRNQRKAKARLVRKIHAHQAADKLARQSKPLEVIPPKHDVFDVSGLIRGHREPIERHGAIVKGAFIAKPAPIPAKRSLTENILTGKLIEKRKRYFN